MERTSTRTYLPVCSLLAQTALLIAATAMVQCGQSKAIPIGPTSVSPVKLQISGPSTIAPGSTAQFSATATYSDMSSKDVTATVAWRSSDTSILTITETGLASTIKNGDVQVSAGLLPVQAQQWILVVPVGTYRLAGRVLGLGAGLDGALVQVTSGVGAGLSSSTTSGFYKLFGVAGDIQLTVSKDGYNTTTQAVTVSGNTNLNFTLVPANPAPDLVGIYTLRFTADPACPTDGAGALPSVGRERQYTAKIDADQLQLTVHLSGANLLATRSASSFSGYTTLTGAVFGVNDQMYYYSGFWHDFAEILSDGNLYSTSGKIEVTGSSAGLAGTLNGTIYIRNSTGAIVAQCTSTHSVTFTSQTGTAGFRIRR